MEWIKPEISIFVYKNFCILLVVTLAISRNNMVQNKSWAKEKITAWSDLFEIFQCWVNAGFCYGIITNDEKKGRIRTSPNDLFG